MHSQKTSVPSSNERQQDRPRNPGDVVADFIDDLRSGDDSELFTSLDAEEAEQEERAIATVRRDVGGAADDHGVVLPPVLQRIFGTDAEDELMAVAKLLDPRNKKTLTLVFHTPIGDVRTAVNWCSHPPDHLNRAKDLLLIMVRTSAATFSPNPGSDLEISFAEHRSPRLKVTCLAAPMRLYPGVGVDLLCFLPHTDTVEKNGQLRDGAPSVVSGLPSTHTGPDGEPVADGEKAASQQLPPEDWDRPRALNGLPGRAAGIED
jgi:hypothetical protein